MANLILPSLEIQNFRAFEHLRIERLGRVNLITGKNNVGKTSLLEALYLYAGGASPYQLLRLLDTRDELPKRARRNSQSLVDGVDKSLNIRHLIYGRENVTTSSHPIRVGRLDNDRNTLVLEIVGSGKTAATQSYISELYPDAEVVTTHSYDILIPHVKVTTRSGFVYSYMLFSLLNPAFNINLDIPDTTPNVFVKASDNQLLAFAAMWDRITLTPEESTILDALKIIAPDVEGVNYRFDNDAERGRIPFVRLTNAIEPVPLLSLGEGMNRLFGIALALTSARDGILLIDEVEIGLHYSVMPDVWRLIFQVAQRLNVQVFATTHSWDCIEAFERAAREDENADGELIHLMNKNGKVFAVLYDEQELQIVTRELIEVR